MAVKKRLMYWLLSVTLAAGAGSQLGAMDHPALPEGDEALAVVELQTLRERHARAVYQRQQALALGEILTNRLVMQTTSDKGVKFNPAQELIYPRYLREVADFNAFGPRLWPIHAVEKLAQQEWPETRLRQFHQIFQAELSLYEVRGMEIVQAADLADLKADRAEGVDFEALVARYAVDADGLRHEIGGQFTRCELEEICGEQATAAILNLQPGATTPALKRGPNYFLFQLIQSRTTYEELEPELRKRVLKSRRLALIYREFLTPGVTLTTDAPVEYDWAHWQ